MFEILKNTQLKINEPVKLRAKRLSDGSESLYLDIYLEGIRKYEFLRLYLLPEINSKIKVRNKHTFKLAETIRYQRIYELYNSRFNLYKPSIIRKAVFLSDWLTRFQSIQKQKGIKGLSNFKSVEKLILKFSNAKRVCLHQIDKEWAEEFVDWLKNDYKTVNGKRLSESSQWFYVSEFSKALNLAVKQKLISENPFQSISKSDIIRNKDGEREFLTPDELRLMENAFCDYQEVKQAYMFSCYTGLRISDIREVTYDMIRENNRRMLLNVTMKKTGKQVIIPLSDHALKWVPAKTGTLENEKIFKNLPVQATINSVLRKWASRAGVRKHLTYHTSRHTFGTLLVNAGADLFTTSKLMGHSDIKTTQIYARILDSKKIEAVRKLDKLFGLV